MLFTALHNFFVDFQGHLQWQVHGLVEEVKVFGDGVSAEPVSQVSQLKQAGEDEQHVPDEDVQPAGTQPAPQSIAEVARGQEAKDVEGPKDAASPHVTQEDDAAGQLVGCSLHNLLPGITHRRLEDSLVPREAACTHPSPLPTLPGRPTLRMSCHTQRVLQRSETRAAG